MARTPIVLIHGYSASSQAFDAWREILQARGYAAGDIHVLSYRSLTNEVTIEDLAEGFDRALRVQAGLDKDETFDAVVHSTGMLVVRAWLTQYCTRRARLRRLIGLAPATFGSPLAHRGRGWLGGIFAGSREAGPDFMEAGDLILRGLELGSRFTWDLAHADMIGEAPFYGETRTTPFVFTFCGTEGYRGLKGLVNEEGTDGTVRLAGCPLNTRKIVLDLTLPPGEAPSRVSAAAWSNADIPLVPVQGLDHGTIMSEPSGELVDLVMEALAVHSRATFLEWLTRAKAHAEAAFAAGQTERWQQLVFRVVDERGQPVPDYFIDFLVQRPGAAWQSVREVYPDFKMKVHTYAADKSLRCFHLNLDSADVRGATLGLRLIASSGTELVAYQGYVDDLSIHGDEVGLWNGVIDLSSLNENVTFFYPFTTTLVEVRLNREPMPLAGFNELVYFTDGPERRALEKAQELTAELRKKERDQTRLGELTEQFERELEAAEKTARRSP